MVGCVAEHRCSDEKVLKETEERIENLIKKNSDLKEVEVLSKPLVEWLRKNRCPHDNIIITDDGVYVMSGELFIPTREIINKEEEKEKGTTEAHTASDNKEKKVSEIIEEYYESCARTLTELSKNPAHLVKYVNFINCITNSINKTKETLPNTYLLDRGFF